MVAAHIFDLRAAASVGMRTIYVPRLQEESDTSSNDIKTKAEGGEVDLVVPSFTDLANVLERKGA